MQKNRLKVQCPATFSSPCRPATSAGHTCGRFRLGFGFNRQRSWWLLSKQSHASIRGLQTFKHRTEHI
jgi:hypothetical protein